MAQLIKEKTTMLKIKIAQVVGGDPIPEELA